MRLFTAARLARVAQACRYAVDGDMDAALHPLIRLARAVASHQFDLQVVQRVNVRKAVADGVLQGGVVRQALLVAGDPLRR